MAYPEATIDVLASPSNHEVFEADPHVNRVRGRRADLVRATPGPMGLSEGGLEPGPIAQETGYELGIDVRGDVLSVLVLDAGRRSPPGRMVDGWRIISVDRRRRLDSRPA